MTDLNVKGEQNYWQQVAGCISVHPPLDVIECQESLTLKRLLTCTSERAL